MSFKQLLAADMAYIVNFGEFSEPIEYTFPTGVKLKINAVVQEITREESADIPGFTGELGPLGAYFEVLKADLDSVEENRDKIWWDERCWRVSSIHDKTTASWLLYAVQV